MRRQRLACFDRTVGEMASATAEKELVILDRATMRETRKGLFGFNLPKLKLFGGGDEDARDEVKQIDSTITGIRSAKDGLPVFTIEEGARWKQTDGRNIFPKVGQKITIKAAALGSYMASIEGRAGVRVMRLPKSGRTGDQLPLRALPFANSTVSRALSLPTRSDRPTARWSGS